MNTAHTAMNTAHTGAIKLQSIEGFSYLAVFHVATRVQMTTRTETPTLANSKVLQLNRSSLCSCTNMSHDIFRSEHVASLSLLYKPGVHKFSEDVGANSKFQTS